MNPAEAAPGRAGGVRKHQQHRLSGRGGPAKHSLVAAVGTAAQHGEQRLRRVFGVGLRAVQERQGGLYKAREWEGGQWAARSCAGASAVS